MNYRVKIPHKDNAAQQRTENMHMVAARKLHPGELARENNARQGGNNRKSPSVNMQMNSAVNQNPPARDPWQPLRHFLQEKPGGQKSLSEVVKDEGGAELQQPPPSRRRMGRARRVNDNSALDRKSLIRDPREERESFRRRKSDDEGDERPSIGEKKSYHYSTTARRNTIHSHKLNSPLKVGDNDEDEPVTRPSEPARRRRPNRSTAFDVNGTRASLMSRLKDDASAQRFVGNLSKKKNFRSSLTECLGNMGFDPSDIEMAIESTNANSSDDAARVAAWLGDHKGECKHEEEDDDSTHSCDETQYTKHTHVSTGTDGTTETAESDERVQELKDSLVQLGFSKDDIKRQKELYRRHSDILNAQDFISVMLEMDDECAQTNTEAPPLSDMPSAASQTNAEVRKSVDHKDSIVRSLSDMGFEKDQVENVISDMHNLGVSKIDVDKVLAAVLGGDSSGSRSGGRTQRSRGFDQGSPDRGSARNNRGNVASSKPSAKENQRNEENSHYIEISPGQFAQLLKGCQTWNAVHNGTAVSAACIPCNATLQCCPEADYVVCPDCNVVSPLTNDGGSGRKSSSARNLHQDVASKSSRRLSMGGHVGTVGLGYKEE